MPVSKDVFRRALGHFASGVTVIAARGEDGDPHGITVSAFTSLSLEPPLVLICIDKQASLHKHLKQGGHFAANILDRDQESISKRFAAKGEDRFEGVSYSEGETGSPILEGVLAYLECKVVAAYPGGDHTIFVGEVEATGASDGKPLIYFRGNYAGLG